VLPFWLWGLIRALRGETLRMPGVTRRIEPRPAAVPVADVPDAASAVAAAALQAPPADPPR
jgi:hypothetical protein